MRVQHLRECLHLAQTLSFTQTAREFFITQPVLSKHISQLERDLGAVLFLRDQHGVALTKEGEAFVEDAAGIVQRYDLAVARVKAISEGGQQSITLGYLAGASRPLLARAINLFAEARPDVELNLVALEIDEIPEAIDVGRIDVGITSSFNADFALSERYGWTPIFPDRIVLLARKDHPLAARESISISDLAGQRMAFQAPQFMKRDSERIAQILEPVLDGIELHRITCDLESIGLVIGTGDYVQIGFEHLRNRFGEQFAYIPIADAPGSQFHIGALWRKERESQAILDLSSSLLKAAGARQQ
ncbi:MAG: LysR family transcriptional regulator [Eggerthellaceae bacterium]|nr:LysR family transcriptional regulator [Eggerthellaceae bacterium]